MCSRGSHGIGSTTSGEPVGVAEPGRRRLGGDGDGDAVGGGGQRRDGAADADGGHGRHGRLRLACEHHGQQRPDDGRRFADDGGRRDTSDETFTVVLGALPPSVTAGSPASVEVTITAGPATGAGSPETPPEADAGPEAEGKRGGEVALSGSGTAHAEGSQELSYRWRIADASHGELAGLTHLLSGADGARASFTVPKRRDVSDRSAVDDGNWLEFELTVTDGDGEAATDTMRMTIRGSTWRAVHLGVIATAEANETDGEIEFTVVMEETARDPISVDYQTVDGDRDGGDGLRGRQRHGRVPARRDAEDGPGGAARRRDRRGCGDLRAGAEQPAAGGDGQLQARGGQRGRRGRSRTPIRRRPRSCRGSVEPWRSEWSMR